MCTAHQWLAANPDGWVTDPEASPSDGLVEFKNPYSYRDLAVHHAITADKCDCLFINNGCIKLKHTQLLLPSTNGDVLQTHNGATSFSTPP